MDGLTIILAKVLNIILAVYFITDILYTLPILPYTPFQWPRLHLEPIYAWHDDDKRTIHIQNTKQMYSLMWQSLTYFAFSKRNDSSCFCLSKRFL